MRVDFYEDRDETRDALDRRWADFLTKCSLVPVYIPNHLETVKLLLDSIGFQGIILSGGNSIRQKDVDFSLERNSVETFLIEWTLQNSIPLLGVCRGMQILQNFYGIPVVPVDGHVGASHEIYNAENKRVVNSYHNFATFETNDELDIEFRSKEGAIEAISHKHYPLKGIMWHPEREYPYDQQDVNFIKEFFGA